jgi:hypothetical protein
MTQVAFSVLPKPRTGDGLAHAVALIEPICRLAGPPSFVADLRAQLRRQGVVAAIEHHDTPRLFEWLVAAMSFQGIGNRVAADYMARHGRATWAAIEAGLAAAPPCPKLGSYWAFADCRYHKAAQTCAEPAALPDCPVPGLPLRNGSLNQLAYSLFLFVRDLAGGDLVRWIDERLASAGDGPDRLPIQRDALLGPLRRVYGVSDKVLAMTFAGLLLAASGPRRGIWGPVGGSMIAVDTLVHNFLARTGILARLKADHAYGPGCYRPGGCADILQRVAETLDVRKFNPAFPKVFPRFVQVAIWRYCAATEFDICNGNRIDDRASCINVYCRIFNRCDRIALRPGALKPL